MTTEPTPTDPQAGNVVDPQAQAATTTTPEPQAGEGKPSKSAEDYERMIAELRKENASHRTKLKKFEDDESQRAQAQLSEQEKLQQKLAKLQADHDNALRTSQERIINYEVRLQAAQAGIIDPDAASKLLDWSAIEYDDNGQPKNVKELLANLLKAKPYLAGKAAPPTSGGATNPSRIQSSSQPITKEYVNQIMRGGNKSWNELSSDEQRRISTFIRGGGLR